MKRIIRANCPNLPIFCVFLETFCYYKTRGVTIKKIYKPAKITEIIAKGIYIISHLYLIFSIKSRRWKKSDKERKKNIGQNTKQIATIKIRRNPILEDVKLKRNGARNPANNPSSKYKNPNVKSDFDSTDSIIKCCNNGPIKLFPNHKKQKY
jgi:hypothetical protein